MQRSQQRPVFVVLQGNWEEAEQLLQDAYEKDAKGADTLANLVVAGLHLGKNTSRYAKCAPLSPPLSAVFRLGRLLRTWCSLPVWFVCTEYTLCPE